MDQRSDQELGLQLADLVAGEVRRFFVANNDILNYGTTKELIAGTSHEPLQEFKDFGGTVWKTGRLTRMPPPLKRRFFRSHGEILLPAFGELFAAGIITAQTDMGQPRDFRIFDGVIWDQVD